MIKIDHRRSKSIKSGPTPTCILRVILLRSKHVGVYTPFLGWVDFAMSNLDPIHILISTLTHDEEPSWGVRKEEGGWVGGLFTATCIISIRSACRNHDNFQTSSL